MKLIAIFLISLIIIPRTGLCAVITFPKNETTPPQLPYYEEKQTKELQTRQPQLLRIIGIGIGIAMVITATILILRKILWV
jgi:hypothetical protein